MSALYLRRTVAGFVPDTEQDRERVRRFKMGEVVKAEVSKPRNYEHHKKLFALCQLIAESSDVYDTTPKALTALKIVTGHVDFVADPRTGELVAVPKSVAFDAMDQIEFSEWYEKAVTAACAHIVPHMNRVDVNEALDMVAAF